ncbi:uncharacterized protein CMU_000170 [Cryptosporidium muris RN66]|uniref:Uncharacterized protein n=1 Tax=Cryptosporidium muris (strain RN66) TaxID=441375 RepID=B6AG07_CRYMR|nr:uncharacterized protein CMU_000170 [Cryptosporidium muris RN66]EEA07148.1 hypothetical protein, conserved [Cryptosporidium muris RN66]|eukprot:XP_002141497.1 hypothetical protein [Cryptosporidium muris RN66]
MKKNSIFFIIFVLYWGNTQAYIYFWRSDYDVNVSFIHSRTNAWDIVYNNYETFSTMSTNTLSRLGTSPSTVGSSLLYPKKVRPVGTFPLQISQTMLILLTISVILSIIVGIMCCYYLVSQKDDFSKVPNGYLKFVGENRPNSFENVYKQDANMRHYLLGNTSI